MSFHPTPLGDRAMNKSPDAGYFRIRIRGAGSESLRDAFPLLELEAGDGEAVLSGALPDLSALYGVLAEIAALGLELLEVHQDSRTRSTLPERAAAEETDHGVG